MTVENRKQFAPDDLAALFRALEQSGSACVLMGGQAANYWALRYARVEPVLREIQDVFPFVSKDADFQGGREDAIALARTLGCRAEVPSFRRAFGNLMAGQFAFWMGADHLKIEVLRKVPGLKDGELLRLTTFEQAGEHKFRVLNPVGVLLAKTWNVVNIEKKGRHDAEQLLAMVPCVRAYIREFLQKGDFDRRVLRAGLNLIKVTTAFTELRPAAVAAARCGIDWSQVLPHAHIAASALPELIRMRELAAPRWLAKIALYKRAIPEGDSLLRLLEILARHAEPWCAQPAPRRESRIRLRSASARQVTHHASRRP